MIVIKVGGGRTLNHDAIAADIQALHAQGERVLLVHGGGEATTELTQALGMEPRFVTSPSGHSSRFTDRETLHAFMMAVAGGENQRWVERLQQLGINAFGLSGLSGRVLQAPHKRTVRSIQGGKTVLLHGDHTGGAPTVKVPVLQALMGQGLALVLAPLGVSDEGVALNLDADRVAAAVALAMQARALVLLSNVPGLLRDVHNPDTLWTRINAYHADEALAAAQGRMKKKVMAAVEAVQGGVATAVLASGLGEAPVQRALAGQGTVVAATSTEEQP